MHQNLKQINLQRITNSPIADVFVVWAKLPSEEDGGKKVIRGFILERGLKIFYGSVEIII